MIVLSDRQWLNLLLQSLNKYLTKNNLYENKNEIDCILKDLGSDLSLYYAFLLAVWTAFGYHAFVPAHISVNDFFGSMDDVCGGAVCWIGHQDDVKPQWQNKRINNSGSFEM